MPMYSNHLFVMYMQSNLLRTTHRPNLLSIRNTQPPDVSSRRTNAIYYVGVALPLDCDML